MDRRLGFVKDKSDTVSGITEYVNDEKPLK